MRHLDHKGTVLVALPLSNSTCTKYHSMSIGGAVQASFVLLLSITICMANLTVILVVNSRRYSKYIHQQPRYLLTSLASNDLAIGVLVTPFGFLPALYRCWPYSETLCQIQALLRGALTQQSAVILVCMAVDRYACMLHPVRYHKHSTRRCYCQACMGVLSVSLVVSLTVYSTLVLPRGGYYFNLAGLGACDPFYPRPSIRILAACSFYFPTTMILMYCYGSAFHVNKIRRKRSPPNSQLNHQNTRENEIHAAAIEKMVAHERRLSTIASRTMAAMSLGFIVMVTPWTIQEVVVACTGSKMPSLLDFLVTWSALSNSFWNPFLYWLLNSNFRRICRELFVSKILCRRKKGPPPPARTLQCCSAPGSFMGPLSSIEMDGYGEKYWGGIVLERTHSSGSLHPGQKVFPPPPPPPRSRPPPDT